MRERRGRRARPGLVQEPLAIGVEADHVHALGGQLAEHGVGDEHARPRLAQELREPLRRVRRIEGQVRSARLEDPQHAHDEIRRAREAEADDGVRPHAELPQVVG
jgi:hypothetical protein